MRGEPSVTSDQGVFLSVAARIAATISTPRSSITRTRSSSTPTPRHWRRVVGRFLLDALWLGLAALSMALLVRELPLRVAVVAAFSRTRCMTGWYLAGVSMRTGVLQVALALVLASKPVRCGGSRPRRRDAVQAQPGTACRPLRSSRLSSSRGRRGWVGAQLGWWPLGGVVERFVAAVVLGVRGELSAYLDTITYNVHYASALSDSEGLVGRSVEHLGVAVDFFRAGEPVAASACDPRARQCSPRRPTLRRGARAVPASSAPWRRGLLGSLVTIGLTAYWEHHLQVLAYPATCIAAALISSLPRAGTAGWSDGCGDVRALRRLDVGKERRRPGDVCWTSSPISRRGGGAGALVCASTRAPGKITYAVLGSNSENGHAAFIGSEFDLVCAMVQLYPFQHARAIRRDSRVCRAQGITPIRPGDSWLLRDQRGRKPVGEIRLEDRSGSCAIGTSSSRRNV